MQIYRRGGRAAEGAALEKRYPLTGIVGSNPTLSATRSTKTVAVTSRAAKDSLLRRDDREAEGARLESVCARKGTEGSNPSLSATISIKSMLNPLYHPQQLQSVTKKYQRHPAQCQAKKTQCIYICPAF